jgi:hypothetical protein
VAVVDLTDSLFTCSSFAVILNVTEQFVSSELWTFSIHSEFNIVLGCPLQVLSTTSFVHCKGHLPCHLSRAGVMYHILLATFKILKSLKCLCLGQNLIPKSYLYHFMSCSWVFPTSQIILCWYITIYWPILMHYTVYINSHIRFCSDTIWCLLTPSSGNPV